jgi:MFS family permease
MTNDNRAEPRPALSLFHILALVLLWNSGFKGARMLNTLFALELGAQPFEIGLLLATYGLLPLVLGVYAGRLADRYGLRMPLAGGITVTGVGIALPYLWPTLGTVFVSAAVSGAGFVFVQIGMQTLIGSLAEGRARTRNMSMYALTASLADFFGPVLAGFSIDVMGYVETYPALALLTGSALVGLTLLASRLPRAAGAVPGTVERRMIDLLRVSDLRRVFISSAVVMSAVDLFQLYIPLYAHGIGLAPSAIGLVMGAFAVAGFITRAILPLLARTFGEERTLTASIVASAVTFVFVPFVESGWLLGTMSFVLGLGLALGQPLTAVLTYNYSPPGRTAEAMGLRLSIHNSMHVVVPAALGGLGSVVGVGPVFWVSAAILGVGARATRRKGGE